MVRILPPLVVLLAGCTSGYMRDAQPWGPPGPDEAKVVFFRTSMVSSVVAFPVYDGAELVGFTEKGSYFEVRCVPGRHVFTSGGPPFGIGTLNADLAAGKTYYVKSYPKSVRAGCFVWGLIGALSPVTRESKDWARIERRIGKMHCRELIAEKVAEYGREQPVGAEPCPAEQTDPDAPVLTQEDGK